MNVQHDGVTVVHFEDAATGLPCRWVCREEGACSGYVGVAARHPYFGVGLDECPVDCQPGESGCEHSPAALFAVPGGLQQAGTTGTLWWFSFECSCDFVRARAEMARLAHQLAPRPEDAL